MDKRKTLRRPNIHTLRYYKVPGGEPPNVHGVLHAGPAPVRHHTTEVHTILDTRSVHSSPSNRPSIMNIHNYNSTCTRQNLLLRKRDCSHSPIGETLDPASPRTIMERAHSPSAYQSYCGYPTLGPQYFSRHAKPVPRGGNNTINVQDRSGIIHMPECAVRPDQQYEKAARELNSTFIVWVSSGFLAVYRQSEVSL